MLAALRPLPVAVSLLMLVSGADPVRAQAPEPSVPAPLRPWLDWALHEAPEHGCAFVGGEALCGWPGRLSLSLSSEGGSFDQRVRLDRPAHVLLPGGTASWPTQVRVDGRAQPVVERAGRPALWLAAGEHALSGRFVWPGLPERLPVPSTVGLVSLSVAGKAVPFPKRDDGGELWLSAGSAEADADERLGLTVQRRIEDAVPLRIVTRIQLRASGRAREVSLGQVLLAGSVPVSIESDLPARLEPDGQLRMQVRAGTHRVEIAARSQGSPERLAFPVTAAAAPWPEREVWVFAADEALRQVELSGAPAVDPARTELADDWRGLPTFALVEGQALAFQTVRRGEPEPPPDRIELSRQLWLDLDGRGYTVRDQLDMTLHQGRRLDLLAGELGHVQVNHADVLITRAPDGQHAGVELRQQRAMVQAEWRAADASLDLPAVAWSEDVHALSAELHTGPGYELLAVRGVDDVGGDSPPWLDRWDLFDLFFVLLVAIALGKLLGWPAGVLALAALALCHHERGAPDGEWLFALATLALLRGLPAGRLRLVVKWLHAVALLWLVLAVIPLARDQVKVAMYPQLGHRSVRWEEASLPRAGNAFGLEGAMAPPAPTGGAATPAAAPLEDMAEEAVDEPQMGEMEELKQAERMPMKRKVASQVLGDLVGSMGRSQGLSYLAQDPEVVVQTGPGVPTWQWHRHQLSWTGPVTRDHRISLILLSPIQTRLLSLLRLVLLGLLLWRVLLAGRQMLGGPPPPAGSGSSRASATASAALVGLSFALLSVAPGSARADIPSGDVLRQLRERLTAPHACRPRCATVERMAMAVGPDGLRITQDVHVQEATAVALPGPAETWVPAAVAVDGRPEAPVVLRSDGFLYVRLSPGVHTLTLQGPMAPGEVLTLAVPERPQRATATADGFQVDGIRPDGTLEGALQITRLRGTDTPDGPAELEGAALPAWLRLTRELSLGTSWTVRSRLERVGPPGQPLVVKVPLLPGESVTDSELEVADGQVSVPFGRATGARSWSSTLTQGAELTLVAAAGRPYSERWTVRCGPIWHCELDGLSPVRHMSGGLWQPEFAPWPGERVSLRVQRPEAAPGQSVTIDEARLHLRPGVRMLDATLTLSVRNSRGGVQSIGLPEQARVQELTVNHAPRPIRREDGALRVTLGPGEQSIVVAWQQPLSGGFAQTAPRVSLGRGAVNVRQEIDLPADRWLLWVSGPAWGPAILFWPYLLLVIGIGLLLGRVRHSPLSRLQWVLLGLGLTRVPAVAALVVVGWFFAIAWRGRNEPLRPWLYDLRQLALLGWTAVALGCLYGAVHEGLLAYPDMDVAGPGSSSRQLRFLVDRVDDVLPTPSYFSAPVWVYRAVMLAWSLWLAASLVRWLRWAFQQYSAGGLWKRLRKPKPQAQPPQPGPAPSAGGTVPAPPRDGDGGD